MTFFCVLRDPGSIDFVVKKLDINLWVLPGIFGRRVMFCDLGMKLEVVGSHPDPKPLACRVGVPFVADEAIEDLAHFFYDDRQMANLVFGNNAPAPAAVNGLYRYDDGNSEIVIAPVNLGACANERTSPDGSFGLWRLQTLRPVAGGETLYVRIRFQVRRIGRTWSWQRVGWRRSYVIADLRVNELREKPNVNPAPDFANDSKQLERVNFFLVVSSRLKVGQISPRPKYNRLLEGRLWESYLRRRLGRRKDVFVITFWRDDNVTSEHPFRAFMELERRRPTAGRYTLMMSLLTLLGVLLLTSPGSLQQSIAAGLLGSVIVYILAIGATLPVLFLIFRMVLPYIPKLRNVPKWIRSLENWRYRLKG